jgi:hypothetical protein
MLSPGATALAPASLQLFGQAVRVHLRNDEAGPVEGFRGSERRVE